MVQGDRYRHGKSRVMEFRGFKSGVFTLNNSLPGSYAGRFSPESRGWVSPLGGSEQHI